MTYTVKPVAISFRSRVLIRLMGFFVRNWMRWIVRGGAHRVAWAQILTASRPCTQTSGMVLDYYVVGRGTVCVPGHVVGDLGERQKTAILYLHGGAFILPAAPMAHAGMLCRWCKELDAVGFMPDYRLAPGNQYPAPLDDCEKAYRALLDLGFDPKRIVLAGESAGGNLVLTLLLRLRRLGLPPPVCAVPISPATELGRIHGPPARAQKAASDPLLPTAMVSRISDFYQGAADASDPELSPLFGDLQGLPPLYLLASDNEILMDDTLLFARRAREAGVSVRMDIWPKLPHAFPLFEALFPEAREARKDILAFIREQLPR